VRANLSGANLGNANLEMADLRGAYLGTRNGRANLSGVNLELVENLTQAQLDCACGDAYTEVPKGMKKPPPCPAQEAGTASSKPIPARVTLPTY
jgi:uncharacterized protein YjbI with pentapeptide repeats